MTGSSLRSILQIAPLVTAIACSKGEVADDPADEAASSIANPSPAIPPADSAETLAPVSASAPSSANQPPSTTLLFDTGQGLGPAAHAKRILHVGDSMVPLVGNYLRLILNQDGRRYEIVSTPSSSTLSWARDHGLRDAMYRYDPQVVIISLGSNELFDPNPQRRARAIRTIVSETRGRPCLWIGPPAWKKDKGFLRVLEENVHPCRYFDSSRLDLERMADGRHPSWSGSHKWASEVWKVLGGTEKVPANAKPKPQ